MYIDKTKIIATLRSRGQDAKADFVDRQLPPLVDIHSNRALLEMLGIEDPASMAPVEAASQQG